jgi:hypothetical protein
MAKKRKRKTSATVGYVSKTRKRTKIIFLKKEPSQKMSGTTGSMNCLSSLFPFPSVAPVAATNCNPFFFSSFFFLFFVTAFLCRQSTTKELGEREENSFSISTLFIRKRPDLCGLSGPDGKAIIGNPESKKKRKKNVGRLLGCARG